MIIVETLFGIVGKLGGTAVVARLTGEAWRFSFGLGALIQTKGLMEVVVLTVLLDAKVITVDTFSALILMAVVTTAIAMPLARLALGGAPALELEPAVGS